MIEKDEDKNIYVIEKNWQAYHSVDSCGGPSEIKIENKSVITDIRSSISGLEDSQCITRRVKEYHKAGQSVVESEGYLPYGGESEFMQTCRYHKNLLRVTQDINIRKGTTINRHFSVGSLNLKGKYVAFTVIPPAQHQSEGSEPYTRDIPDWKGKELMIGHWHRPPIAIIFHRKDGIDIEVGTGFDVWRWEENLGYHPESGSYKINLNKNGLEFIREPLACCEDFLPAQRNYRFTWHIAWNNENDKLTIPDHSKLYIPFKNAGQEVDFERLKRNLSETTEENAYLYLNIHRGLSWPDHSFAVPSSQAYCCELVSEELCWQSPLISRRLKKIVRRISEMDGVKGLILEGIQPGVCYNPSHVDKKDVMGLVHWDINPIFDFLSWLDNHVKDKFKVFLNPHEDERLPLPSLEGFFK
ncbi:hypothetical protein PQO03_14565 [Lentisphaera profundi]|uniref:Uncharacterized protein n=1 Tax=Lentisphaera profundi TaxID=1658616 RepID=A0ABY7W1S3_9BACT|nr:hypothetical protein [Lentisphaera profundi]WDE99057.1 hypothetical protein PQO03_14565 [Lentisphaera profundi]